MIGATGFSNWLSSHPNLKNVTASAFVVGGIYCLDEAVADGDTADLPNDQADNVIVVASGNVARGTMLIATDTTAAGARGRFIGRGFTTCKVLGDSGQAYLTGLIPVASQAYLASASTNTNIQPVATCLQANTNATVTTVAVKFDGIQIRK